MTALAQVTMSKLIGDYRALVPLLRDLGFSAGAFSYPQQARLGSSSLAWSSDSRLVNFESTELVEAFDAVDDLRSLFPVNNPRASVADMKQHLLGQPERFVCYGGYKSFYMDWNFDMWRCDAGEGVRGWGKKEGSAPGVNCNYVRRGARRSYSGLLLRNPVAVEKLARHEFAEIASRQEVLQTIIPNLLDICYHPIFDFFQKNRPLQQPPLFSTSIR